MIRVRLMGGLGNQLFQYAAGRRLALRHGTELVLDHGWFRYEAAFVATPRAFELERFALPVESTALRPRDVARWEQPGRFRRRRPLVIRQREGDMRLDPRVVDAPADVLLIGYWQSEGYFSDVGEVIKRDLGIAGPGDESVVSVHVRRGDYAAHAATRAFHGLLPDGYYREAIELVRRRVGGATFRAFSDDIEWVERELAPILPLEVAGGSRPDDDLRSMAACGHHVIANSSFSWWGAWLGEGERSIVVAPKEWFGDPSIDEGSIVPERWLRL